jgi:hypothetical protein
MDQKSSRYQTVGLVRTRWEKSLQMVFACPAIVQLCYLSQSDNVVRILLRSAAGNLGLVGTAKPTPVVAL